MYRERVYTLRAVSAQGARRPQSTMQPVGAPASTSRQPVYYPPCADLWDTVYPTELMVCSMLIRLSGLGLEIRAFSCG